MPSLVPVSTIAAAASMHVSARTCNVAVSVLAPSAGCPAIHVLYLFTFCSALTPFVVGVCVFSGFGWALHPFSPDLLGRSIADFTSGRGFKAICLCLAGTIPHPPPPLHSCWPCSFVLPRVLSALRTFLLYHSKRVADHTNTHSVARERGPPPHYPRL